MVQPNALHGLAAACLLTGAAAAQPAATVDFRRDVQPIFREHCYECHGPTQQMNSFRLDRRRDAMKGGSRPVIGPGNSQGSRLYLKLISDRFGMRMPPTGPLAPAQIGTIKEWIEQGAQWPDDVAGDASATQPDPRAARLIELLRAGDLTVFRRTLAADPTVARLKGAGGATPLMTAALYGDAASLRLLLSHGADPNARNDAGATALMWAADDLEKARLLVEFGADVNARSDDGRTPLMIAAACPDNTAVVKLLLDRGAAVNSVATALIGRTAPLIEAAKTGNPLSMRLLLEHGADVNASGSMALAWSMRGNCSECVAMVSQRLKRDLLTPAMFLISPPSGPATGVKELVERGAVVNTRDPRGNSILAMAAASEALPVASIQALLDRGADVNGRSADGESALELALRHGRTPVADLLRKAGAAEPGPAADRVVEPKRAAGLRAALARSLPLLQRADEVFLVKSGCVSCHNNSLTSMTLAVARKAGMPVDEGQAWCQSKTIGAYLEMWRDRVLQNAAIPGDADTAGFILLGLAAANYQPDPATDGMAIYLKRTQLPDGHWNRHSFRPPLESSEIEVTAAAMRGLQVYGPKANRAAYDAAVRRAANWLAEAPAVSVEDRVFQILGLDWAGGHRETLRQAASALLTAQRSDGGWSQIPTLASDGYATGQSLAALLQSGELLPAAPAAKRAIEFLMSSQAEDGSWHVRRRAMPIQPYFDSGFPYGRDQFISASATNWAATALALAIEHREEHPTRR